VYTLQDAYLGSVPITPFMNAIGKLHTKSSSWDTPGACGVGVPTGASRNSGGRSEPDEALIPSSSPTAGAN
jgi:hypothetical protein